ncbi:unnamed protein product [Meganyctiphanes norvegica]|uniref:Uncharacterized protein n=1 Tax=Meganyctiphanes norvegica TaxID=48144 RepID=A0AAV2PKQ7_MEGNR
MLYAACFEDHYQGTSMDDPNYSEIYRYLSQLLAGEEPTQLTSPSAAKVIEMINRLKKLIKHKDSYEYFRSLHSQNPLNPKIETVTATVPPMENTAASSGSREIDGSIHDEEGENNDLDEELDENDPYFNIKKEKILKRVS